jgi:hypothetical protein
MQLHDTGSEVLASKILGGRGVAPGMRALAALWPESGSSLRSLWLLGFIQSMLLGRQLLGTVAVRDSSVPGRHNHAARFANLSLV